MTSEIQHADPANDPASAPQRQSWRAPTAPGPVSATVAIPGSKSMTNRALILAALADGPSRITGGLRARDTALMVRALRSLGVDIAEDGTDWVVTPAPFGSARVDAGLAGTVMRFLPPLAALGEGEVVFDGDARARERPMAALLDGLRQAGVRLRTQSEGRMPFTIQASGSVIGGEVHIDASQSSQFVSGLLLAGARYQRGLTVRHVGEGPVPSLPHIEMTLDMLRYSGVSTQRTDATSWTVSPGPIRAVDIAVEPDLSNAAPFLAAAMVTAGEVRIPEWPNSTRQAGDRLRDLFTRMGAQVSLSAQGLLLRGPDRIAGFDADLSEVGELTPVLAAVCAAASGPSHLYGIAHLRGHETDRLASLAQDLQQLGAEVDETPDSLRITPHPLHAGIWNCFDDHRMAQAGAVLGLVIDGVEVDDIACTSKTLPDFPGMWTATLTS